MRAATLCHVDFDVGKVLRAAAVVRAVQVSELVSQLVAAYAAGDLHANVAIRDELGRIRALDEANVGRRLQALEPDRRLELAGGELEVRREAPGDVGVLDHRLALREVRREPEVINAADRPLDDRPHAAQQELVVDDRRVIAEQRPVIGLHQAAQLDLGTVGGAERKPFAGL
jgi:hypothetical protein